MKRVNRLRQILAEGKVAVGTCVDSYSPAAIEVIGYSGLDWVRVCNEYSWRRDESMEHMMRAADSGKDWVEWCDQELMVGVMIENEQVVSQVEKIMAIEGLDYCLFGPADYSMSIGLRSSQKDHPKVQEAIKRTVGAAVKHKKAVAIGIGEPYEAEAKKYIDMGLRIIEVGHELGILRSVYKKAGAGIRAFCP